MSSVVDNRVVSLQFDNRAFEEGIAKSLHSIDRMNEGIASMGGSSYGPMIQGLQTGLDNLNKRFSTLGIVGMRVINRLTDAAINFGTRTMTNIITGGKARALTMEHAHFMLEGMAKDGKVVETIMDNANKAVTGTAYGLDEAANAAAQLYASGVKEGKGMYTQLRAIAGVAAMTGRDYTQVSDIFTTAAAKGKLANAEISRLSEYGLNATAVMADYLKVTQDEVFELAKDGKISFQDFAKAMDKAYGKHAQDANKTFTGSLDNIHAALKRIGAMFWTPALEDMRDMFNAILPQLKLFQGLLEKTFVPAATKNVSQFLKFFTDRIAAGEYVVRGLINVFRVFLSIARPIKKAFLEVFPPASVESFKKGTKAFRDFVKSLVLSKEQAEQVHRAFVTIFSAIKFIGTVIIGIGKTIATFVLTLAAPFSDLAKQLLEATGNFDKFGEATKKADSAFDSLSKSVSNVGNGILTLLSIVTSQFSKWASNAKEYVEAFTGIELSVNGLSTAIGSIGILGLIQAFSKLANAVMKPADILENFTNIFKFGLKNAIGNFNYALKELGNTFKVFQAQLQADIIAKIGKSILMMAGALFIISTIPVDKLGLAVVAIGALGTMLVALFTQLSAIEFTKGGMFDFARIPALLLSFGSAMIMVAAAVKLIGSLSIDQIAASVISVGILLGVMSILVRDMSAVDPARMTKGLGGLISMAIAVRILASAAAAFGKLPMDDLLKGMGSILVLLASFTAMTMFIANGAQLLQAGAGILAISIGLSILSGAVEKLSAIPLEKLQNGMIGVGSMLGGIAVFVAAIPEKDLLATAVSLIGISIAIKIISNALSQLSAIGMGPLGNAIATLAVVLASLVVSVNAMTGSLEGAAAVLVVAIALRVLMNVLIALSDLSWEELGKGMVGIGGALLVLVAATSSATTAIGGAFTLLIIAAGITVLAAAIKIFSSIEVDAMIVALLGLVGSLMAIAALSPMMMESALSIAAVGASLIVMGLGVMVVATALKALGEALPILFTGLEKSLEPLKNIGKFLLDGLSAGTRSILSGLKSLAKIMGQALVSAFKAFLGIHSPSTVFKGFGINIVTGLINGIKGMVGKLPGLSVEMAKKIINGVKDIPSKLLHIGGEGISGLIKGLGSKTGGIVSKAKSIMNGIKGAFGGLKSSLNGVGRNAIQGLVNGMNSLKGTVSSIASSIGNTVLKAIKAKKSLDENSPSKAMFEVGKFAIQGLINGMGSLASSAASIASDVGSSVISNMNESLDEINESMSEAIDIQDPRITPVLDISKIQSGMNNIDSMFSKRQAMAIDASVSNASSNNDDLLSTLVKGFSDVVAKLDEPTETKHEINVPLMIDGRTLARAQATYTEEELSRQQNHANRKLGIV